MIVLFHGFRFLAVWLKLIFSTELIIYGTLLKKASASCNKLKKQIQKFDDKFTCLSRDFFCLCVTTPFKKLTIFYLCNSSWVKLFISFIPVISLLSITSTSLASFLLDLGDALCYGPVEETVTPPTLDLWLFPWSVFPELPPEMVELYHFKKIPENFELTPKEETVWSVGFGVGLTALLLYYVISK